MLAFFSWVRAQVKAAVLGGIADAMAELEGAIADAPAQTPPLLFRAEPPTRKRASA